MSEKKINDGGPARPTVARDGNWQKHHDGMSLRDHFAGLAMQGLLSIAELPVPDEDLPGLAKRSYAISDAMIAEREKRDQ